MKRSWRYSVLFTALLALTAGGGYAANNASSTIKVGIDLDLTGPIGPGGIDLQKGLMLGLERLGNALPGKKIEFIVEDSASDASTSVDKAKKLVETDKVAMIIGPIHGGGMAAAAQYVERVHVPRFDAMPTTDSALHEWSFGPVGLDLEFGYGAGIYAADVLHYKTAVELAADFVPGHLFNEGFTMAFEAKGGKVLQETYYPEGTTNVIPFLTALKQADVFVYWGTPGDCFAMFPQYKELNMKMPILQPEDGGVTSSPGMLKNLGTAAVGTVFGTAYLVNANYPGNKEFVEAYQEKYHELPGVMAGVGYAHVQMLMAALKATGGNVEPDVLYKAIKEVSVDTVRGHLKFSPGAGPFGTVANLPYIMGKIGPNMEIEPILPVSDIGENYENKKFIPFVYPAGK
jgi:branched-chain amino acid transport system substrate-binding protein